MDLELLDIIKKQYAKKDKDSELTLITADKAKPLKGLVIKNPLLEYILDRRFLVYGRFYLIYGKKGCSKTSLFYALARIFQAAKGNVFWLETERADDLDYAKKQGVDLSQMAIEHPETIEKTLDLTETIVRSICTKYPDGDEPPTLICLDSIAGSTNEAESDVNTGLLASAQPGVHARLLSKFYRRLEPLIAERNIVVLVLNQLRNKIGAMGYSEDSQDALIGGEAQFFHSTYHWKMSKVEEFTEAVEGCDIPRKIGSKHKLEGKRNKLGREGKGQVIEFDLYIDGGIDWYSPLVKFLAKHYKTVIRDKGSGNYLWLTPETHSLDPEGQPVVIDTENSYKQTDLAMLIFNSDEAQEKIRDAFGIPKAVMKAEIPLAKDKKIKKAKKEDNEGVAEELKKKLSLMDKTFEKIGGSNA